MQLFALVTVVAAFSVRDASAATVSPIQKVLALLADLQQKVLLDGEVEQKQYEKFTEWCEDTATKKQYEVKNGKAKIEDRQAVIEKTTSESLNQDASIKDLAKSIRISDRDLKAATEIREKEKADFDATDKDLEETIDMLGRAIGIIEKSMKDASFAQVKKQVGGQFKELTEALAVIVQANVFAANDKTKLESLLQSADDDDFLSRSAPDAKAYENHSGGIIETLEDLKDKAQGMRNDAQKAEMDAKHGFNLLAQSLKNSLKVDNKALDEAKQIKFAAEEAKAVAEGDLAMAQKVVAEGTEALKTVGMDCQQKAADHQVSVQAKDAELKALADAQTLISEKATNAASTAYEMLETSTDTERDTVTRKVIKRIEAMSQQTGDVALNQLAIRVQAAVEMSADDVFGKVRSMISEMIDKLVADAAEEADHKAWCDKETSETQEKIEDHQDDIERMSGKLDKATATIAQLTESIAASERATAEIAKQQAAMNTMRAEEKKAFKTTKKDYEDGIEGLTMALQVLREYYATSADPADAEALVQQPEVNFHSASTGASTGIIGLLEVAQADFTKLLADAEAEEATAQAEYEKTSHEMAVGTAMKQADVKYEKKEKAGLEKHVAELKEDRAGTQAELDAVTEYYARVRPGCTTKPMTYDERKGRRESEIAGLKEALEILAAEGEPTSFLAVRARRA